MVTPAFGSAVKSPDLYLVVRAQAAGSIVLLAPDGQDWRDVLSALLPLSFLIDPVQVVAGLELKPGNGMFNDANENNCYFSFGQ